VVEREHNSQLGERLAEERRQLRPLPAAPMELPRFSGRY
jgi:hypothetical protein